MRALSLLLVSALALGAPPPAPPSPAAAVIKPNKPRSPFPTDAQCQSLGPVMNPIPFGPGETLDFDIDALGARAGTMTMQAMPIHDGVLPLEVNVETNTFFSKVRSVKGVARSELSPKTLRPSRYFEDAHENEFHRVADVTFKKNKSARLLSTINGQTYAEDMRWATT